MRAFAFPIQREEVDDPEGIMWMNAIRMTQVWLVLVSFTVIHLVSNPLQIEQTTLASVTAFFLALECFLLIVGMVRLCRKYNPDQKIQDEPNPEIKIAHTMVV